MASIRVLSWRHHKPSTNGGFASVREAIRWVINEENNEQRSHSSVSVDGVCVIDAEKLRSISLRLRMVKWSSDQRKWAEAHQEVFGD